MARFSYRVKEGPTRVIHGTIDAETRQAAIEKLLAGGLFPLDVREEARTDVARAVRLPWQRIRAIDLMVFTRQLADLLEAGLTIHHALSVLSEQTDNRFLRLVLQDLRDAVRQGEPFSEALSRHPKVFNPLYVSMVRSGEVGGGLGTVLARLADFAEQEEEIKSKVQIALAYPTLIMLVGAGTIVVLLTFVIPRMVAMFRDMGQALPLATQILIGMSTFFVKGWWAILIAAVVLVYLLRRARLYRETRLVLDRLILRVPVVGPLFQKVEVARMARGLSTLFANGIPILQALDVVAGTLGNEVLKRDLEGMARKVKDGASFSETVQASLHFPPFVSNMIAVGEEGGVLEQALLKVAVAYDRESDRSIKILTSLLEPVMILVMGLIVGFIVISMLLPIFEINILAR